MKIAIISDIHSNYIALNSALNDINKQNIEEIFCLGDLVGYAPYPDKVFPILKDPKSNIKIIMGNYDEAIALEKDNCGWGYTDITSSKMGKISFEWTRTHTSKANKEWIKKLPREIRLKTKDKNILMVHGSPTSLSERVDLLNDNQIIVMMEKADANVLFCAHTHMPYHKIVGSNRIVNSGECRKTKNWKPTSKLRYH